MKDKMEKHNGNLRLVTIYLHIKNKENATWPPANFCKQWSLKPLAFCVLKSMQNVSHKMN